MTNDSWTLAAILGTIQGLTEFLPVSSSGHLIVVSWFMEGKPLPLGVNVALHFGTLFALLLYFWRDWMSLLTSLQRKVVHKEASFQSDTLLPALIVGSIPAAIVGLLAEHEIEEFFHSPTMVVFPLFFVGFLLWYTDKRSSENHSLEKMSLKDAFLIGLAQMTALIPGVSRSGATITAGRCLKFNREEAARFSFLLGTPAMGGAAILHYKDLLRSMNDLSFYIGLGCSFLVGCLAISFFLKFIVRFGFLPFALYRAGLAGAIFYFLR